jgi:hypothetical protein
MVMGNILTGNELVVRVRAGLAARLNQNIKEARGA